MNEQEFVIKIAEIKALNANSAEKRRLAFQLIQQVVRDCRERGVPRRFKLRLRSCLDEFARDARE